jgi:hypothetical protein
VSVNNVVAHCDQARAAEAWHFYWDGEDYP